MHKAIAFTRRSTNMQDMSLEDQKTLLANWMQSAPIIQEMGIDPEPSSNGGHGPRLINQIGISRLKTNHKAQSLEPLAQPLVRLLPALI